MDQDFAPGRWLPTSFAEAFLRFHGDLVELRMQLRCRGMATGEPGQRLVQLLADDELLLAELPLGPLQPDAAGLARVSATVIPNPPAGQHARKLSLALVSARPGGADKLHDRWRFALPHRFAQPSLEGAVRLQLASALPTLGIEAISNPRAAVDRSGTLALELWSLDQPYQGGSFQGKPLGSVTLGSLAGQQRWTGLSQAWHLPVLHEEPASSHLTLMLREWTTAGYVTRDWRELDWPRHRAGPVISLNRSSTAALRSVHGVSDRLARTIVASRPFATVDELRRVRGMSARLFARLRDRAVT
jgi:Helix-hairpin-helix motif